MSPGRQICDPCRVARSTGQEQEQITESLLGLVHARGLNLGMRGNHGKGFLHEYDNTPCCVSQGSSDRGQEWKQQSEQDIPGAQVRDYGDLNPVELESKRDLGFLFVCRTKRTCR